MPDAKYIATVVKSTGSWYTVQRHDDQEEFDARIVGKFRLKDLKLTNPIAVGDVVNVELRGDEPVITEVVERRNYVVRQSPRKKHFLHLIASNIDLAVLVVTVVEPKLKQGFIDRFLMMTEPYNIPVHIVFNKADLYSDEDRFTFEYLSDIYNKIGYSTQLVSCVTNDGIEELETRIKDQTSLFSGQSGVGKSTLLNTLMPHLELRTSELSDYSGKGMHTTTFAEMFSKGELTKIIDTPGIKTLSFNHLEIQDVAHNFREFFEYSVKCKFSDCTHQNEPKCAVKQAIEAGEISELRYANYIQIIEEIEAQNYWERHKG